jgi:hypothetical protein
VRFGSATVAVARRPRAQKTIGFTAAAEPPLAKAGAAVDADEGVVRVGG